MAENPPQLTGERGYLVNAALCRSQASISFFIAAASVFFVISASGVSAQSDGVAHGRIGGHLVDGQTGDPLIGGGVFIHPLSIGSVTDLDGAYIINRVPEGRHTVTAAFIGYQSVQVVHVEVVKGKTTRLDLALQPALLEIDAVVVEASAVRSNEASLLRERQKAATVSDAISADMMSRGGAGSAASAMDRVTGASIIDSRYVFIRGLGDRYISTQLNGTRLPSADPDRQAVHLDMFPTSLIESIVTTKTASPDRPGDFTGGAVNMRTKSIPDQFIMNFSTSITYNSETTWSDSFLTDPGGMTRWHATNSGKSLPDAFAGAEPVPYYSEVFQNTEKALLLDTLSRAFTPFMAPAMTSAPISRSYSISVGNNFTLFGKPAGFFGSATHGRDFSLYRNGVSGRYARGGAKGTMLNPEMLLSDSKSSDQASWSVLSSISLKPAPNHELRSVYTRSQDAEMVARYQSGSVPRDAIMLEDGLYETRVIHYTERSISSLQALGDHYLPAVRQSRLSWSVTTSSSNQEEPDLRYFTNHYRFRERRGTIDTTYSISPDIYPVPARYFRSMNEDAIEVAADVEMPFFTYRQRQSKVKAGVQYLQQKRSFNESRFDIRSDMVRYAGDPNAYFGDAAGIVSSERLYRFGTYIEDATDPAASYSGSRNIPAVYGMVDLPVAKTIRFAGGVRYERTDLTVASRDTSTPKTTNKQNDFLPSANVILSAGDNTNIRAAYSQTVARPTFRELAPYQSFHYVGDFVFLGNAELKRTLSHNADLRWEWFPRSGEIIAVSVFGKLLRNPIEKVVISNNGAVEYQNVVNARVSGLEFEVRKRLDRVWDGLSNFEISGNLTLAESRVVIPESEMRYLRAADSTATTARICRVRRGEPLQRDVPRNGYSARAGWCRFLDSRTRDRGL